MSRLNAPRPRWPMEPQLRQAVTSQRHALLGDHDRVRAGTFAFHPPSVVRAREDLCRTKLPRIRVASRRGLSSVDGNDQCRRDSMWHAETSGSRTSPSTMCVRTWRNDDGGDVFVLDAIGTAWRPTLSDRATGEDEAAIMTCGAVTFWTVNWVMLERCMFAETARVDGKRIGGARSLRRARVAARAAPQRSLHPLRCR